ncbi:MAG: sulfatase-like hydrolase/transferase, partial [Sorangiineae bacterium]|nr:sulfatase-like hydrolase/transferase [Sorangiineae bacterium]
RALTARARPTARAPLALAALVALIAGLALAARPAAARLSWFDNFRLLLLERAPLLAQAVRLSALLAPPPPLEEAACANEACGAEPAAASHALDLRGRDLLLVTVDALRADHVGAYGYARPTTPNLDALAKQGARFEAAYCPTPHTSYSLTSLMTGKYLRPLLRQGAGEDSDTWASLLRTYGYRTAAFYPPAVFFIDPDRFTRFEQGGLGFEYRKVEFAEGERRSEQLRRYLAGEPATQRVFAWVHLFAPHEPYEAHPNHQFGDRDVDRYDSEIAFADQTLGELVRTFREQRPDAVVIVTADHGEEFGEHGGHYHGTSVYEEQVRVPLVISAPGAIAPGRHIPEVVQTIDLLPTVLGALDIPRPPRIRGRDLGDLLAGERAPGEGLAFAETDEQELLAKGRLRLICQRQIGACQLFDLADDPAAQRDRSRDESARFDELRRGLRDLAASHGRFEERGLRAEGKGWPPALLRGLAGDGDAAEELAPLLDDADVTIRRKAAEVLFQLHRKETAPALRLALARDEDDEVRRWAALALTRLGEGAPLVFELVRSEEPTWRRLAALALGEVGDGRGEATLVAWWKDRPARDYQRSRELLAAFAAIRAKDAVWPLVESLDDVRLRPYIATTLAAIGEDVARAPLAKALARERYQGARVVLMNALVELGAGAELAAPLVRWLGVPDPLPGALGAALEAGILEQVGGPDARDLVRLRKHAGEGVALGLFIPRGGNGRGIRAILRARAPLGPGQVHVGLPANGVRYDSKGNPIKTRNLPRIDPDKSLDVSLRQSPDLVEVTALVPPALGLRAGRAVRLVVYADHAVELEALALVPLADELPPPAPKPWRPAAADAGADASDEEP